MNARESHGLFSQRRTNQHGIWIATIVVELIHYLFSEPFFFCSYAPLHSTLGFDRVGLDRRLDRHWNPRREPLATEKWDFYRPSLPPDAHAQALHAVAVAVGIGLFRVAPRSHRIPEAVDRQATACGGKEPSALADVPINMDVVREIALDRRSRSIYEEAGINESTR
jgi:hypothetical protein